MNNKEKNIVLIGLTGCGKTTVGKMLAQKMNYDFIDMDDFIVESTGKTVPELFAISEEYFRNCETEACKILSNRRKTVIASGGGAVKKKENMRAFYHNSIIVFLDRPVDNIVGDVEIKNRPLLVNGPNILYRLHDERYDVPHNGRPHKDLPGYGPCQRHDVRRYFRGKVDRRPFPLHRTFSSSQQLWRQRLS